MRDKAEGPLLKIHDAMRTVDLNRGKRMMLQSGRFPITEARKKNAINEHDIEQKPTLLPTQAYLAIRN